MSNRCSFVSRRKGRLLSYVSAGVLASMAPVAAQAATVGNPLCPGEDVQFNPGNGQDIVVPPGFTVSVFKSGLNFPTGIAFRRAGPGFEVYVLESGHEIGFGIGIAHGFATLGTIGFEGRFDYAAIGTVSNVASRLCDEAKPGQILISPRVLVAVEDAVNVEPVGDFTLKGISRPVAAYNVLSAVSAKI